MRYPRELPLFLGRKVNPRFQMSCRIQLYAKVFGKDRTFYRDDIIRDLLKMGGRPRGHGFPRKWPKILLGKRSFQQKALALVAG